MTRKLTIKDKILNLLRKGTPMLSVDMARILKITIPTSSTAAKELHDAGLIHIDSWQANTKNGGRKVYAYGAGKDAVRSLPNRRYLKISVPINPKTFVPHPDVAAAWMMT